MLPILSVHADRSKNPAYVNINLKPTADYPSMQDLLAAALDYFKVPGFDVRISYTVDPFAGSLMIRVPTSHLLQTIFYHEFNYPEIFARA